MASTHGKCQFVVDRGREMYKGTSSPEEKVQLSCSQTCYHQVELDPSVVAILPNVMRG